MSHTFTIINVLTYEKIILQSNSVYVWMYKTDVHKKIILFTIEEILQVAMVMFQNQQSSKLVIRKVRLAFNRFFNRPTNPKVLSAITFLS